MDAPTPASSRSLVRAVAGPVAAGFGLLARLRGGRRALHPLGRSAHAVAHLDNALGSLRPGRYDVVVRWSRGAGLPAPWPDVTGVAIRFPDAGGSGRHQDVLLSSSARPPLLRHVPVPTTSASKAFHTSLSSFAWAGGRHQLGAAVGDDGTMELFVTDGGGWRRVGCLTPGVALNEADDAALDLDVWHDGAGLAPVGPVNALRRAAYAASRRARGARSVADAADPPERRQSRPVR